MSNRIKYSEFKEMVKDHTPVEADRDLITINDSTRPAFYDLLVRAAYVDLQRLIKYYREEHETLYRVGDVSAEGSASKFNLPCDADLKEIKLKFTGADCNGNPVADISNAVEVRWDERQQLICGKSNVDTIKNRKPFVAIQPNMSYGYIWPALQSSSPDNPLIIDMVIIWDGVREYFDDDDMIRAGWEEAETASYFVLSKLYRQVDEVGIADRMDADFRLKRRKLYVARKRRARLGYHLPKP
jgi:hypothetical protein